MTNSILQHAPEDVKIAASFMQQQPLDPTLEARVEASGLAYMFLRRAERAEQQIEVQFKRAEQAELTATNWEHAATYASNQAKFYEAQAEHWRQETGFYASLMLELDQGSAWQAEHIRQIEEPSARQEAELAMIGAALGVAERQRKQAESERDQHARAITAWHLEAQRAQAETSKIDTKLHGLATAVVALLADDMDGEEEPHPDVAALYTLAYAITQGGE